MKRHFAVVVMAIALLASGTSGHERERPTRSGPDQDPPGTREITAAFTASYNLDHDQALGLARRAVALDPTSSRNHRGLASIIWLLQVFQRGAMTVDHYLGSISTQKLALPKPDPELAEEFNGALAKAIELAEKRLRQKSDDLDAMFDVGSAYAIKASYMASVEGGLTNAFRSAQRAYSTQSEVLRKDPSRASAGLIVGGYQYVIATQPALLRMFAFLAGFSSGRDGAITLLEAASHHPMSRVEGKSILIVIYSREGRHSEAMRLAHELSLELPRNRLLLLEEGSAGIRAGRAAEAEAVLTKGLAAFDIDTRPKIRSEHALWLYKRGLARLNQNHPAEATADLKRALTVKPLPWVEGRIHVALGKLADLGGRRAEALDAYTKGRAQCTVDADTVCINEARQYQKQPFRVESRRP